MLDSTHKEKGAAALQATAHTKVYRSSTYAQISTVACIDLEKLSKVMFYGPDWAQNVLRILMRCINDTKEIVKRTTMAKWSSNDGKIPNSGCLTKDC